MAGTRRIYAGPLKIKRPLADFRAADRAIGEVVRRGLFRLKTADAFEFRSYFDSPAHVEKCVARSRYAAVDGAVFRRLERLLRRHPRARILEVSQTRLRVLEKT